MAGPGLSICPLASGSRGNAVFVSGGEVSLLVDAGLSGIELERRMAARELSPESLSAVVVTHEHTDHVKGAGILSRRYNIPLFINEITFQAASKNLGKVDLLEYFECGKAFSIGDIHIQPFSISHDAGDPAGLTLEHGSVKLGIATDMGVATGLVKEHLKDCNMLYLEANHDLEMLINGPYPWYLKQRVKGRKGHLSNTDAGNLLSEISSDSLSHVTLAHLSQENNTPDKALEAVRQALDCTGVCIEVAGPDEPGDIIHL